MMIQNTEKKEGKVSSLTNEQMERLEASMRDNEALLQRLAKL